MVTADQLVNWYEQYVGVHEATGRNDGVSVHWFQSSTGAYNAPWCVSFLQKGLQMLNVGRIADRTAGVFYLVGWARRVGLTRSHPKRGYFCAFLNGQGHIGIVDQVRPDGSFTTVEGNHNNSVQRNVRWPNSYTVYVQVPNVNYSEIKVVPRPKVKQPRFVPRFEIVTAEAAHPKVLVAWGKWRKVGPRIPKLVARGVAFKVRRKMIKNPLYKP